ncbi:A disintegrin and metalloproteinase with thrombospondin motifs adt-2-like [Neocloeon triangulifer]|uniref:A disintegrin and metalloproteinase with thrombospondin motifs adt-2-like n=1 Tax=Neocloeon triangulifer TaxID=2078957 RepID=UPI00286EE230|nr:A disintegrin and metalloproteinase with thrombospondin motifs adt-2-like [Neocloeon triangulifer]
MGLFTFSLVLLLALRNLHAENLHESMTEDELAFYLGVVSASSAAPEYQVVFMNPPLMVEGAEGEGGEGTEELKYEFRAFNVPVSLNLKRNPYLIAPSFKTFKHNDGARRILSRTPPRCHYLHRNGDSVAAISMCEPNEVRGVVLLSNETLQISPLSQRLRTIIMEREAAVIVEGQGPSPVPHLVRRAPLMSVDSLLGDAVPLIYDKEAAVLAEKAEDLVGKEQRNFEFFDEENINEDENNFDDEDDEKTVRKRYSRETTDYILELGVFFDEAGYRLFSPFFNYDDKQIRDMLLAYMNAIQALYLHPSLGRTVQLSIVRLDLFASQPSDMPHYGGERGQLLDSFCAWNEKHNPKSDSDPGHWDMGLYVSGLDFFAYEGNQKSGVTMGLATVGGVCTSQYNCVIAELGTVNTFGKPYPSAGFTSVYVLAHEIGHNLGMHHDGTSNSCAKEGFVMSPSRGTQGETEWSSCSAAILRDMSWAKCLKDAPAKMSQANDHTRFKNIPGQYWTPKRQCELLLRDKDAVIEAQGALSEICQNLKCSTPHRSGYYFAGPALEGTSCGRDLWCQGGFCVQVKRVGQQKPISQFAGGWSAWKEEKCSSGCTKNSKGSTNKRRNCDNPKPVNTEEGCDGPSFSVGLCDDNKMCRKRITVEEYAAKKCKEFSRWLPELDSTTGLQAPHESDRLWMSCSIFCKRKDTGAFYTPRLELNDLGVDPYFPDGTLCNTEGGKNFFCLQHHCLPEGFNFDESGARVMKENEVLLPQNAGSKETQSWPQKILNFFSLGSDKKSKLKTLNLGRSDLDSLFSEEDWEDKDYREIPH